jgi:hypothetical protein
MFGGSKKINKSDISGPQPLRTEQTKQSFDSGIDNSRNSSVELKRKQLIQQQLLTQQQLQDQPIHLLVQQQQKQLSSQLNGLNLQQEPSAQKPNIFFSVCSRKT